MRAVGLCVLAIACGHKPVQHSAHHAISDERAAINAFQIAWARDVRPRIADPLVRRIDNRMQEVDAIAMYYAEKHGCREGISRLAELEAARADAQLRFPTSETASALVVFGDPDSLLGRDRCWSVTFTGGTRSTDAEAYLDLTGRLLVAWRVPRIDG